MTYHSQQGVDTCIARIFNTYGPRMRKNDGRASVQFLNQAIAGKPLTVYGDGSQTRSLCYVDDLIRGLYAADDERRAPAREHRQPRSRGDDARARADGDPRHRLDERDRLRGAADRRPADPPPRHHPRAPDPRLVARDRPRGGPASAGCGRSAGNRSRPDGDEVGGRHRRRRGDARRSDGAAGAELALHARRHLRRGADALRADRQDDADAQAAARAGGAAEPLLGRRRYGVAQKRPANATNPADPAYDWELYDRTVRYANAVRRARPLLDLRDAGLGERRPRREPRADPQRPTCATSRSPRPSGTAASSRTARAGSCRR